MLFNHSVISVLCINAIDESMKFFRGYNNLQTELKDIKRIRDIFAQWDGKPVVTGHRYCQNIGYEPCIGVDYQYQMSYTGQYQSVQLKEQIMAHCALVTQQYEYSMHFLYRVLWKIQTPTHSLN